MALVRRGAIMTDVITRPELTMPEAEAALLRDSYAAADVILEYGSGGSTALAAELPGKTVFSVESDPDWAQMMKGWFKAHPPVADVHVIWSDVGKTKSWGYPEDDSDWRKFARYPLFIWQRKGFVPPDVVLVDGRFRVGCALATAFLTQKPVTLLFDDYVQRDFYHKVEEILGTPDITGRMARFDVVPTPIPPEKLLWIMKVMQNP